MFRGDKRCHKLCKITKSDKTCQASDKNLRSTFCSTSSLKMYHSYLSYKYSYFHIRIILWLREIIMKPLILLIFFRTICKIERKHSVSLKKILQPKKVFPHGLYDYQIHCSAVGISGWLLFYWTIARNFWAAWVCTKLIKIEIIAKNYLIKKNYTMFFLGFTHMRTYDTSLLLSEACCWAQVQSSMWRKNELWSPVPE